MLRLTQNLSLQQRMAPQLIQSLQLLQMSTLELNLEIKQQMEMNPLLEESMEMEELEEDAEPEPEPDLDEAETPEQEAALEEKELKEEEVPERNLARRQVYRANIVAAGAALSANEMGTVRRSLAAAPEEFRNWEWRYLHAQVDRSLAVLPGHED